MSDRKSFFDPQHPWFKPLWVRILMIAICFGWALMEFTTKSTLWGIAFAAAGAYLVWQFFFVEQE
jgi:hypothetical protein